MINTNEMDSFTAVVAFRRLESRLAGTRGTSRRHYETLVVVDYLIVPDGDVRRIRYKDSLKVNVFDCEPCHHYLAQAWIVDPINVDAVG